VQSNVKSYLTSEYKCRFRSHENILEILKAIFKNKEQAKIEAKIQSLVQKFKGIAQRDLSGVKSGTGR
jgi:hypothetical protein